MFFIWHTLPILILTRLKRIKTKFLEKIFISLFLSLTILLFVTKYDRELRRQNSVLPWFLCSDRILTVSQLRSSPVSPVSVSAAPQKLHTPLTRVVQPPNFCSVLFCIGTVHRATWDPLVCPQFCCLSSGNFSQPFWAVSRNHCRPPNAQKAQEPGAGYGRKSFWHWVKIFKDLFIIENVTSKNILIQQTFDANCTKRAACTSPTHNVTSTWQWNAEEREGVEIKVWRKQKFAHSAHISQDELIQKTVQKRFLQPQ